MISVVSSFFKTVLADIERISEILEILDAIFDIFGDKEYPAEQEFISGGWLNILEQMHQPLKKLVAL